LIEIIGIEIEMIVRILCGWCCDEGDWVWVLNWWICCDIIFGFAKLVNAKFWLYC